MHTPSDSTDGLHPRGAQPRGWRTHVREPTCKAESNVAKTTPIEFIRQVRAETAKVVWPTGRETMMTGVMVVIMTTILALFFLAVDSVFNAVVKGLLGLAQ